MTSHRYHGSMALHEQEREDLLRDGRTMVRRGECVLEGITLLVGFRDRGQFSLYGGSDPVFQFNEGGRLRRAFFQGRRFAAERGRLLEITRETRGAKVELVRTPIDEHTLREIRSAWHKWIDNARQAVEDSQIPWRMVGEASGPFRSLVIDWIAQHGSELSIADTPNA